MSTQAYILKRILSSIPILLIVSVISFLIIRLNIKITNINISIILFPILSIFLFFALCKIKTWSFFGGVSLILFIAFSAYISRFEILPFDLIIKNKALILTLNFISIFSLCFLYWYESFTNKSKYLSQFLIFIALITGSFYIAGSKPINLPIKEIVFKSGDPLADLRFNPSISKETIASEEKRLGLNKPWHIQYILWIRGIFHGDLGVTQQNQPVLKALQKPILNTLLLSFSTLMFTWLIALPLGIWAALERNKFIDKALSILTSCGMSAPSFVLAILGLLFALNTGVFPIGGLTSINFYEMTTLDRTIDIIKHLALPTIILTMVSIAGLQRQMRGNLLDVLRQEYIKTAIAKGLPTNMVIYKHALRNAINPLITIFGFEFASLLSGAALTETVLAYPGLGALTLEAARKLDVNLTMTSLMIGAIMLILGNLLADLLLKFADPRIELEVA